MGFKKRETACIFFAPGYERKRNSVGESDFVFTKNKTFVSDLIQTLCQ
jgi:hypothetical protein